MTGGSDRLSGSGARPLAADDPAHIGSFTLLGVLGTGGMGRVYLGAADGRYAAVKRVLPLLAEDGDFLRHFGHELDNLAKLPDGVSARLLASGRDARPPWFATEFVPGITLSDAVRLNGGTLPADALWRLLRDAASGLAAVHTAEMVHRDLKPSNVMLTEDGVTLIDFGVARAADQSRLTKTGMVIGTPAYMAPEQAVADRRLTGAADVFALGSLVLYAANGRPPFGDGSGLELLYRIVHAEPDLGALPVADAELRAVVESCLAKEPEARPSAAELVELAADHVAPGRSAWPSAVAEPVARRSAFAATVPDVAEPPPTPTQPDPAEPQPDPAEPRPEPQPEPKSPSRDRRRRVLTLLLPVVLVGGTGTTVLLLPDADGSPQGREPGVTAPPTTDPAANGGGSSDASPQSREPDDEKDDDARDDDGQPDPDGKSPGAPEDGSRQDGDGGSGEGPRPDDPRDEDTSGGSGATGSGGSGGSDDGGSDGGSTPAEPPPAAPTGRHQLANASDGRCLAEFRSNFSTLHGSECGAEASNGGTLHYVWTYDQRSGGTFRLVSGGSGQCLSTGSWAGSTTLAGCGGGTAQTWRIGATTGGGSTIENVGGGRCLVLSGANVVTSPCDASDPTQLWRNLTP
ncbi:serine/threonine-protein kinase [Streptomyces sp. WMMC1477]|uniref:serine/threonine-protein kinase n=1 Tax=Streptomyces sp. WMMC1477 TaxID=3015155 RepID=UPI0022B5FE81|nr:serine/threonine-protein kinase [Streptomyces sp. WMMC1477]MCZ7432223.1 protein kinase [Streptomyces sp. WMMC1477]